MSNVKVVLLIQYFYKKIIFEKIKSIFDTSKWSGNPNLVIIVTSAFLHFKKYKKCPLLLGKKHPNFVYPIVIVHNQSNANRRHQQVSRQSSSLHHLTSDLSNHHHQSSIHQSHQIHQSHKRQNSYYSKVPHQVRGKHLDTHLNR